MEVILTIGSVIIVTLIVFVVFLILKVLKYRRICTRYEILEKSQLFNDWQKYTPQQTRIHINRETDKAFNVNNTCNRMINNRMEGLLNSLESKESHNHLMSAAIAMKDKKASDEIEITEFEMTNNTNNELPAIDFKLVYLTQTQTLRMHIRRVSNLPLQFRKNCSSYVKISLITDSEKLSSYHTNIIKKSLNPEYEEDFTFSSIKFEELRNLTIRICVYVKRKQLSKRQLVGDLWVPLSRPDLEPDIELVCNEKLSLACPQTGKRGPLLMVGKLGFIFIQIQYQSEAQRIKVVIRKAQNLYNKSITNNFQITKPEYYVIVNLLQNNETILFKETKASIGVSPIWNQPFIFDIKESEVNKYWIQCLVMQGKTYTRDGVIGQVLMGPNTTVSGIQHWNDVMDSESLEISKWHPITSVGTACL